MTPTAAKLVVLDGKLEGKTFEVGNKTVVGRHPEAAIRVPDVKLSREHAKFILQGVDFYIVDLNSRNGTHVNDAKITKRLLRTGDVILVGDTRFRFELLPPPEKTPAVVRVPEETAKPPSTREKAPFREVIDLTRKPGPAKGAGSRSGPAGAISADQIVLKEKALQFSKIKGRKPNILFDDVGQRSLVYQLGIAVVVIAASIGFFIVALKVFRNLFG